MERRETRPTPGYNLMLWGSLGGSGLAGLAIAFEHYVVGAVAASVVVVGQLVWWWWKQRYEERLIAAGVVIDRSAWYREQLRKGDRHAKWLALYLLASMGLIAGIVVVMAIAKIMG